MRYRLYIAGPLPHVGGVVEVCPSNFSWRRCGRGGVKVRNCIYLLGPVPHFGGVVEVEVDPSNYIPRRKSGIYWIQVRRAAAAAVEISLWTR